MELNNEFDVSASVDETWVVLTDIERIAPCMPGAQLDEVEGENYRGTVKIKVGPINAKFKGTATMVEQDDSGHRAVLRAEGKDTGGKGNASATIAAELQQAGEGTHVSIHTDLNISGRVAQFGRGALSDISTKLIGQFVTCLEQNLLSGNPSGDNPGSGNPGNGNPAPVAAADPPASTNGDSTPSTAGPSTATATATGSGATNPAETTPPPTTSVASAATGDGGGKIGQPVQPAPDAPAVRKIDAPEAQAVDLLDAAGAPVAKRVAPVVGALTVVTVLLVWRRRRRR